MLAIRAAVHVVKSQAKCHSMRLCSRRWRSRVALLGISRLLYSAHATTDSPLALSGPLLRSAAFLRSGPGHLLRPGHGILYPGDEPARGVYYQPGLPGAADGRLLRHIGAQPNGRPGEPRGIGLGHPLCARRGLRGLASRGGGRGPGARWGAGTTRRSSTTRCGMPGRRNATTTSPGDAARSRRPASVSRRWSVGPSPVVLSASPSG